MKYIISLLAITLLSFGTQQPAKTISITFTLDEANMVLKGLGKLPAEESMQLIIKISNEANKQLSDTSKPKK